MNAGDPETRAALANLLHSVRTARCQPFACVSHRYQVLVARAIEVGQHAGLGVIATHLLPVHDSLPWVYHYEPRSANEDLCQQIAFAELIGPDGPMQAPACRVGFTVMAEHTRYPFHSHPAVELYWVITGTAQWQTPTSDRRMPPGQLILHRSNEPHAMQTSTEPLLALWGWTGDLDAPAAYL